MSPVILIIGLRLLIVAVFVLLLTVVVGKGEPTGVARSLAIIERSITHHEVARSELPARDRLVTPIFDRTRSLGNLLSPAGTAARLARHLDQAGNPPGWTPEKIVGAKGTGLVVGLLVGLLIGGFSIRGIAWMALLGVCGLFLPDLLVYNAGLRRQDELRRSLADALDMLTVCVEAGQGFDGALAQVARATTGPVAGEFARVMAEIQIGRPRGEAFQGLGDRTSIPEIRNFVSALVQADRLGLPIANVLREQSKEMRIARRQVAEEKAQKVPVKILFPLVFCIFPTIFIVILGPAAIRMIALFSGGLFK